MTRNRILRIACAGVALAACAAAWTLLAPPRLGGSTSYAVVHGVSMEPRLHEGDLVLTHRAASYRVGEIVAYQNRDLGTTVLHRIVGIRGGRYVLEGDANAFVDSYRPRPSEVLGRKWIRVPAAGRAVVWLRVPRHAGVTVALLALLVLSGGASGAARRRRVETPEPPRRSEPAPAAAGEAVRTALSACALAALAFGLLGALAFTRPATRSAIDDGLYTHRGRFSYEAAAPGGSFVYGRPAAQTGQPIFLRLARRATFSFDYRLETRARHSVSGSGELVARLQGADGWSRTFPLERPTTFDGDSVRLQGALDLHRLQTLVDRVGETTGVSNATFTLTIAPRVTIGGKIGGQELRSSFAPPLHFALNQVELQLQSVASTGKSADSLHPVQGGAGTRVEPRTISLLGLHLRVVTARRAAVGGLVASLLALLALGSLLLPRGGGEAARIGARYGSLLLPVKAAPSLRDVVDVVSMESLAGLAEHHDRPILHVTQPGSDEYVVVIDEIGYRYRVGPAPAPAQSPLLAR